MHGERFAVLFFRIAQAETSLAGEAFIDAAPRSPVGAVGTKYTVALRPTRTVVDHIDGGRATGELRCGIKECEVLGRWRLSRQVRRHPWSVV